MTGSELEESGCANLVWMFQMKGTFVKIRLCVALIVRAVGHLLKQRCARICEQSVRDGPRLSPSQRSRCGTVCDTRATTYMLERIALIVARVLLTSTPRPEPFLERDPIYQDLERTPEFRNVSRSQSWSNRRKALGWRAMARVSQVPAQKLIALRPSNFVCACCQNGLRY